LPRNYLKPEERVRVSVMMTNVVTRICADSVRESNSRISEKELISVLRRRFSLGRTRRRMRNERWTSSRDS
jgi:hypothetical protein